MQAGRVQHYSAYLRKVLYNGTVQFCTVVHPCGVHSYEKVWSRLSALLGYGTVAAVQELFERGGTVPLVPLVKEIPLWVSNKVAEGS